MVPPKMYNSIRTPHIVSQRVFLSFRSLDVKCAPNYELIQRVFADNILYVIQARIQGEVS